MCARFKLTMLKKPEIPVTWCNALTTSKSCTYILYTMHYTVYSISYSLYLVLYIFFPNPIYCLIKRMYIAKHKGTEIALPSQLILLVYHMPFTCLLKQKSLQSLLFSFKKLWKSAKWLGKFFI